MDLINMNEMKYYGKALAINFKKFLDRTVDKYNNLFTLTPEESKEVFLEISKELEEKGDYKGAGEVYKKMVASEPNNVDALFKLGKVYFEYRPVQRGQGGFKKGRSPWTTVLRRPFISWGPLILRSMKTRRRWRPSKKPWN